MTKNGITHIERQRELLKSIALDVSDIERIAFGAGAHPASRQQVLAEKLRSIRQTAMAGINDRAVIERILHGYRTDCLSRMRWLNDACDRIIGGGYFHVKDESLQEMALAASCFAASVEKYLSLRNATGCEVDHG